MWHHEIEKLNRKKAQVNGTNEDDIDPTKAQGIAMAARLLPCFKINV